MKVLLINPPIRQDAKPCNFPLGLGYVASVLQEAGHKVEVLDINGLRLSEAEVLRQVKKDYDAYCIGGMVTVYSYIMWLSAKLKEMHPNKPVIVGGGISTAVPHLVMKNMKVDIAILGEGERTIPEVADAVEKGKSLKGIKGIWYREGKRVMKNQPRPYIEDLDTVPFAAWDLFPFEVYMKNPNYHEPPEDILLKRVRSINLISSRGCPYRCSYCYHIFGYGNRFRSAENLVRELKILKEKYKINFYSFSDDCFVTNRKRLDDFCRLWKQEKLDIRWGCFGRVNIVDEPMLRQMKAAGCDYVGYGIESGSQKMLNEMRKGVTVEQAKKALEVTKKVGLRCHTTFMVGMPGETKETIRETVKFCKETDGVPLLFYVTPFPGTELYENLMKEGRIKDEEEFIKKLGDVKDFVINLTKIPDEELIRLKKQAEKDARDYYFRPARVARRTLDYLRYFGIKRTAASMLMTLR